MKYGNKSRNFFAIDPFFGAKIHIGILNDFMDFKMPSDFGRFW